MGRKNISGKRREELVWALFDCLARQGHEQVTVKMIAAQAGVAHGAIHYYFKGKEEIVSTLVELISEKYTSLFDEFVKVAPPGPESMELILDFLVDEFIVQTQLNRVFYNLVQMGFEREIVLKPLQNMLRQYREKMARMLFLHSGTEFDPVQAAALVAVIEGLALQWMVDPDAFTRNEARRQVAVIVNACLNQSQRPEDKP